MGGRWGVGRRGPGEGGLVTARVFAGTSPPVPGLYPGDAHAPATGFRPRGQGETSITTLGSPRDSIREALRRAGARSEDVRAVGRRELKIATRDVSCQQEADLFDVVGAAQTAAEKTPSPAEHVLARRSPQNGSAGGGLGG